MRLPRILSSAAVAIALGATAAGCNNSTSASTGNRSTVNGTVSEWSVGVSPAKAAAGGVTFNIKNTGKIKHEFVVLRTDKAAASLGNGARIPETGHVGETGDIAPGASKSTTIHLAPGHYALVCNLPGHYKAGMHTDFTVG